MATRDIVVIGASAGGIAALKRLLSSLPEDLPASLFVTVHLSPRFESKLAEVLGRSTRLQARMAEDGMPIEQGTVYVSPPDHHLLLNSGTVRLSHGPKENRQRPSINPMFRSAAENYGNRVIGVLLTGMLDDGSAGLWEIQQRGGIGIAQDPKEAEYPSMPLSAIQGFKVDYVARLEEIQRLLDRLTREEVGESTNNTKPEVQNMERTNQVCPECGGAMERARLGADLEEYRCHVGHRMGPENMILGKEEVVQRALWNGLSQLEELIWLMQERAESIPDTERGELLLEIAEKQQVSAELRSLLKGAEAKV